ncbi:MAG: helix-turn-helix transcriptional regulator [Neisseriaceae bacterium]|nr:helix-turn-helix transcriptional regulator [Neisseriaceae bacterium]
MKTDDKLTTWDEFEKTIFTQQEIAEGNLRVALIGELIKARNEQNISQKELEHLSGIKQPSIARVEKMNTDPRLHTLIKLLLPLGKTLVIVPLEKANAH